MSQKGLSIIIPVFNESIGIKSLIKSIVTAYLDESNEYEIIVVDDHSTDQTRRIVQACAKLYPVRYVLKKGSRGKGHSLLEGYAEAVYDYVAIIDADMEPACSYLPRLHKIACTEGFACTQLKRGRVGRMLRKVRPCEGPKVFTREVFEHLDTRLISAWYAEAALITTAKELGYKGGVIDIDHNHLHRHKSLVEHCIRAWGTVKGTVQMATSKRILELKPQAGSGMLGAGVAYRKKRFVTHSTLPSDLSALQTFTTWQWLALLIMAAVVSTSLVIDPRATMIVATATLSFIYLLDVIFNLYVTLKSLHFPPEVIITPDDLAHLRDRDLPVYTILCPLYREARVLPHFIKSVSQLDYPQNKLDVILLLEEGDTETIEAAHTLKLPSYIRTLVVPHSLPKTKPKACNYGLAHARGDYIVIYDAEDQPEPDQLKKSYLAFKQAGSEVVCLQAKLNYYNPRHNLLTRLFTAEYSLWFDVILPGLQSIKTTIPLGGTSNHFRAEALRNLHGWDPFNVTEDADLGTRLFSAGYQTAIIDSTTLEEANSNLRNWVRQRSRWLKGYMQTYLVHMRNPLMLIRSQGWHALLFNLIVGGKIAFILINPLLWAMTISYFVLNAYVGAAIEAIYPAPVFYMAATSLVVGNFVALYNYMIGVVKRGHWDLVKHVYLIPLYWLAISYAAAVALLQLFIKPHYWEKTIHGFHLSPASSPTKRASRLVALADRARLLYQAGGVMVAAGVLGNFLNFLYTSYLGRTLSLADFGAINLFGSLLTLIYVPIGAVGSAITHKSAYLLGKYGTPAKELWLRLRGQSFKLALGASLLYLLIIPLLMRFFHFDSAVPFLLFAPAIVIGTLSSVDGGFMGGALLFTYLGILTVLEAVFKLIFAVGLTTLGAHSYVYAVLPLSMATSFVLGYYMIKRSKFMRAPSEATSELTFPSRFFASSFVISLTTLSFTTLDLILAKHFLSPGDAGIYSYLSLAGKMVFLASSMFSGFVLPYVSRAVGQGEGGRRVFNRLLLLVTLASLAAFTVFGALGFWTVPVLWGEQGRFILPYLIPYSLAMVAYSISSLYVRFHQARGEHLFSYAGFVVAVAQVMAIILHHHSIVAIAEAVVIASVFSLVLMLFLDRFYGQVIDFGRALLDFVYLFKSLPPSPALGKGKLRILIFNWRDTKHVWAGGAETYIHELGKRWVKLGHQVTIFCGSDGHDPRHATVDGVRIIRRGGFYLVYFWAFLYYRLRLQGKYDVIIDSENGIPFFTPLYAREKVFLLIHHVHQEVFRKSLVPPLSWFASFLEKRLMPLVYRKIEVITVSPSSKAEILLHKLTKKEPHVVYNGVDLSKCVPGQKSKTPLVLYLGRLTTAKSVHVLIRAAVEVIASVPKVKFVVAGDGPARSMLMRMVRKMRLDDFITFTGKVSEEEKISWYQKAWVFVNPSLIEGWGITTIEANACGVPVVASNVAGLRDAVHNPHSGLLVPYGNVEEFARAITDLLVYPGKRRRMSREARDWARKFDWNKSAKEGIKVLHRTI